jgi:DNA repair protein RecO (recombination protein O)
MPAKERSLRVEGIVLQHTDFGEADRLLTIYTRELGKIRAIVKGVRKPRSRKAGHIEPFTRTALLLARGRNLFILTQAEAIDLYSHIKEDLVLLGYGSYIIELLSSFTFDGEENQSLYRLVKNALHRIDRGDDPNLVTHYYEIRLLDIVGYRPKLFNCAQCTNEIKAEDQYFSSTQGGILCPRCGSRSPESRPISMDALRYLRHFQRSSYNEASRAKIQPTIYSEIESIIYTYLTHILEKGLKSPSFLKRMIREQISSKRN